MSKTDRFFLNISFSGVVHKELKEGFIPISTFSDGFTIELDCEEGEINQKVNEILDYIKAVKNEKAK